MPAKSSENEPPKDGSPTCQCGKGTSDCSIHPSTPEKWTASTRDSLVRTLALPGIKRALDMRHDPAFIEKSSVLLASFDPVTCSLKTCQQSLVTDSEPYSQTLPRWGSLRNGDVSEHPIAAHRITGIGGSHFVPTPDTMNHRDGANLRKDCNIKEGGMHGVSLHHWAAMFPTPDTRGFVTEGSLPMLANVCETQKQFNAMAYRAAASKKEKYWPTPATRDYKGARLPETMEATGRNKETNSLPDAVSEQSGLRLNPVWVGWLMGFPIGWASLKATETRKSRSKPQLPGNSLEANDD